MKTHTIKAGIKKVFVVFLTTALALSLTACGSIYEDHDSSYLQIDDVPGVTFDMPRQLSENATAITEVSAKDNYDSNTFVYKDGVHKYLLFNIDSVVIIASNDTKFDFNNESVKDSLKEHDLDGIWFKADKDGLKDRKEDRSDSHKVMANVKADVSITPSVYGTFSGVFANVSHGDYECSIFAGMTAGSYSGITSSNRSVLEHIVKTLKYNADTVNDSSSGDATKKNDSDNSASGDAVEPSITKVSENDKDSVQASIEKIDGNDDGEDTESIVSDLNNDSGAKDSDPVSKLAEQKKKAEEEKSADTSKSTKTQETEISSKPFETSADFNKGADVLLSKTNNTASDMTNDDITTAKEKERKAKTKNSNIYNMLKIGDSGKFKHLNKYGKDETDTVRLDTVYTEQYADKLLSVLLPDGEYKKAPAGESWHIARFYLSCDPTKIYTDVRVRGLDGGKLNYNGISYSSRTYDIQDNIIRYGAGYADIYVYYLIPNGCKSYMLEFGDRDTAEKKNYGTACYLVTGYRK